MSHSSQTNLQCPITATNRAHLLKGEGAKVCVSFAGPDAKTSFAASAGPFQLGGLHMMCWVTHCTNLAAHMLNQEFVFEVPSSACWLFNSL